VGSSGYRNCFNANARNEFAGASQTLPGSLSLPAVAATTLARQLVMQMSSYGGSMTAIVRTFHRRKKASHRRYETSAAKPAGR